MIATPHPDRLALVHNEAAVGLNSALFQERGKVRAFKIAIQGTLNHIDALAISLPKPLKNALEDIEAKLDTPLPSVLQMKVEVVLQKYQELYSESRCSAGAIEEANNQLEDMCAELSIAKDNYQWEYAAAINLAHKLKEKMIFACDLENKLAAEMTQSHAIKKDISTKETLLNDTAEKATSQIVQLKSELSDVRLELVKVKEENKYRARQLADKDEKLNQKQNELDEVGAIYNILVQYANDQYNELSGAQVQVNSLLVKNAELSAGLQLYMENIKAILRLAGNVISTLPPSSSGQPVLRMLDQACANEPAGICIRAKISSDVERFESNENEVLASNIQHPIEVAQGELPSVNSSSSTQQELIVPASNQSKNPSLPLLPSPIPQRRATTGTAISSRDGSESNISCYSTTNQSNPTSPTPSGPPEPGAKVKPRAAVSRELAPVTPSRQAVYPVPVSQEITQLVGSHRKPEAGKRKCLVDAISPSTRASKHPAIMVPHANTASPTPSMTSTTTSSTALVSATSSYINTASTGRISTAVVCAPRAATHVHADYVNGRVIANSAVRPNPVSLVDDMHLNHPANAYPPYRCLVVLADGTTRIHPPTILSSDMQALVRKVSILLF
jgi:hypothetical protein